MARTMRQETETNQLEFRCPECGSNQVAEYLVNYQSIWVREDGEVEIGDTEWWESDNVEFFCWECDRVIVDVQGNPIRDHEDLARWVRGESMEPTASVSSEVEGTESVQRHESEAPEVGYLQFTCPECGRRLLDEVTVTMTLLDFDDNGTIEFGKCYDDCEEEHFRCGGCGWILQDEENNRLVTYDALLAWLRTNQK